MSIFFVGFRDIAVRFVELDALEQAPPDVARVEFQAREAVRNRGVGQRARRVAGGPVQQLRAEVRASMLTEHPGRSGLAPAHG